MLLYEKLDTLVLRPENAFESVERFRKRHFPYTVDQVVGVGHELLFICTGQIVLLRQSKPNRLRRAYSGSDVSFYDIDEQGGKSQASRYFNTHNRMFYAMRPGPADVM